MKKLNIKIILFVMPFVLFTLGCKKDYESSKPTFWPSIILKGSSFVIVPVDSIYNDAGAIVTVNSSPIDFETVSNVDVSTPGYYTVTYSAVNNDGITASQIREVLVVNRDAANDDLSGRYQRGSNNPVSVWVKDELNPYKYTSNNPGGVANNPPFDVEFTIYCVEPGFIVVPLQESGALAPFYATSGSVDGDPLIPFNVNATIGEIAYAWFMNGPNFGPALRTFIKR